MIVNQRALSILEFDKVCGLLEPYIATEIGRANGMKIGCAGTYEGACIRLQETEEADSVIRRSGSSPIDSFPDLRELLLRVHACHSLSCRELLEVRRCLYVSRRTFDTLSSFDDIPRLAVYYSGLTSKKYIEDEIARCIISEDEIADNASPELARIRRQLTLVTERMKEKLNSMIHSQSLQKHLQEPIITVRNGRYAIPVKAASRNQIPGMIHDQSASGQT
ncbi:MAG: endonuclease MutS2, partial [Blautia sp.]|nr:endonuclease MutS2 [Blautia sp.]